MTELLDDALAAWKRACADMELAVGPDAAARARVVSGCPQIDGAPVSWLKAYHRAMVDLHRAMVDLRRPIPAELEEQISVEEERVGPRATAIVRGFSGYAPLGPDLADAETHLARLKLTPSLIRPLGVIRPFVLGRRAEPSTPPEPPPPSKWDEAWAEGAARSPARFAVYRKVGTRITDHIASTDDADRAAELARLHRPSIVLGPDRGLGSAPLRCLKRKEHGPWAAPPLPRERKEPRAVAELRSQVERLISAADGTSVSSLGLRAATARRLASGLRAGAVVWGRRGWVVHQGVVAISVVAVALIGKGKHLVVRRGP